LTSTPFRLLCKQSCWKWFETSARAVRDEDGRVIEVHASGRNVTDRVRAQQELAATRFELERSNLELEQFAFDASHDLAEPLKIMQRAANLLSARYGDSLDEDGRRLMVSIVDGAERMQMLISDLLEYSRVCHELPERTAVDCNELVRDAIESLDAPIKETQAIVRWGQLPIVEAHRTQLGQVFQNLLSNALKYSDKGARTVVQVQARREPTAWLFTVADNGIGIDPRHAERVFEMFRRLGGDNLNSGTGIGLALCRRIVEHHAGRIWWEPRSGGGSLFIFTIADPGPPANSMQLPIAC
jgi:light-regulated signal transduction histidine kinase (bacteriophytochrome)